MLWFLLVAAWIVGSVLAATMFGSMARAAERHAETFRLTVDA